MTLLSLILDCIADPSSKIILEVGSHDDALTVELAGHFKQVCAYYEYVKVPERSEANYEIKKVPYLDLLDRLPEFDAILLRNEFHHFPDIWQMWMYDRLLPHHDLLLVEWDLSGSNDAYYSAFQNCRPLCQLTREILNKFVRDGVVLVERTLNGKYEDVIPSRDALIDFYRFLLPDHWMYSEKDFLARIRDLSYPVMIWEGFDLFYIKRV